MSTLFLVQILLSAFAGTSGILFNGYIICILLWEKRIKTVNHLVLLHLACVDIAFCTLILANTTFGLFAVESDTELLTTSGSIDSDVVLKLQGFFWTLLPLILLWTICGLSFDRYVAICSPLHYSSIVTRKRAIICFTLLWLLSIALCSPTFFGVCSYTYNRSHFVSALKCDATDRVLLTTAYIIAYTAVTIVMPIAFILTCNLQTLLIARHHRHRITSAIYEVTLRAQATVTHQKSPNYLLQAKRRYAMFTLSQLITVAFNVPFYLIFVIESFSRESTSPIIVTILTILLTFSPSINGYIYGIKSRVLKQTFKRLLQRYLFKKQASLEIDRRLSLRSQSSIKTFSNLQSFLAMSSLVTNEPKPQRRNSAPNVFNLNNSRGGDDHETSCRPVIRRQSLSTTHEDHRHARVLPLFNPNVTYAIDESVARLSPIRESLN